MFKKFKQEELSAQNGNTHTLGNQ